MEIRCDHPHPHSSGPCLKLLVVYHNGTPFVRCGKCGQETEIPLEGQAVGSLDRIPVTA